MSLPEITDEDRAVADEAWRLYSLTTTPIADDSRAIAAALVRTGWRPVDPDLKLARECAAGVITHNDIAAAYVSGCYDDTDMIRAALAAIKAADARRKG